MLQTVSAHVENAQYECPCGGAMIFLLNVHVLTKPFWSVAYRLTDTVLILSRMSRRTTSHKSLKDLRALGLK